MDYTNLLKRSWHIIWNNKFMDFIEGRVSGEDNPERKEQAKQHKATMDAFVLDQLKRIEKVKLENPDSEKEIVFEDIFIC